MGKRKYEMALVDAEPNKAIREQYMKTDKVSSGVTHRRFVRWLLTQFLFVWFTRVQNARTSSLFMPIMALEGHEGDIFSTKFHPEGYYLASSGYDRKICMYTYMTRSFGALRSLCFSCMECVRRMWKLGCIGRSFGSCFGHEILHGRITDIHQ